MKASAGADAPFYLHHPSALLTRHHPPRPVCRVTLSFRYVTECLSCRTGGINYRPWPSPCHCSVINGLSERCAMGPGLTVNSTGIQRQTHTQSCTHRSEARTCTFGMLAAFEILLNTCLRDFTVYSLTCAREYTSVNAQEGTTTYLRAKFISTCAHSYLYISKSNTHLTAHRLTHTQRPSPLLSAPSFVNQPDKQKHRVPQVTGSWDPAIPLLP